MVRIRESAPIRSPLLMGRKPDSHSGNAGFNSRGDHQYVVGSLTAEQRIVVPSCAGSSPVLPPIYEHVSERPKGADCKPVIRRFESGRALHFFRRILKQVKRSVSNTDRASAAWVRIPLLRPETKTCPKGG